jgi:hypothetical protein
MLMRFVIDRLGDEKFPNGFYAAYFAWAGALLEHNGDWESAWHQRIRCEEIRGLVCAAKALDANQETAYARSEPSEVNPPLFDYQSKIESVVSTVEQVARGQELTVLTFAFNIDRRARRWSNNGELRTTEHTQPVH